MNILLVTKFMRVMVLESDHSPQKLRPDSDTRIRGYQNPQSIVLVPGQHRMSITKVLQATWIYFLEYEGIFIFFQNILYWQWHPRLWQSNYRMEIDNEPWHGSLNLIALLQFNGLSVYILFLSRLYFIFSVGWLVCGMCMTHTSGAAVWDIFITTVFRKGEQHSLNYGSTRSQGQNMFVP
jgi:hypothetical protein